MNFKNILLLALFFLQVPVSARMNFAVLPLNQGLYMSLSSHQCHQIVIPSGVGHEIHRIKIIGQGSCQESLSFLCSRGHCLSENPQKFDLLSILDADTYLISSQTETQFFIRIWP